MKMQNTPRPPKENQTKKTPTKTKYTTKNPNKQTKKQKTKQPTKNQPRKAVEESLNSMGFAGKINRLSLPRASWKC